MFKLKRFLTDYKRQVIIGPIFKLIEAILELLLPFMMKQLVDIGIKNHDSHYIFVMGAVMLATALLGMGCAYICQYSASIASQGTGTAMRNALFRHIMCFSDAELDRFGTTSLITRVTNDVTQLQYAVAMLIRLVIRAPFLCIGGLVMAMIINLKLSLILVIAIPLFILVLTWIMRACVPLYKKLQQKLDTLSRLLRESLSGIRVIRSFSKNEKEKERFAQAGCEWQKTAVHVGKISALMNPITTLIMNFAVLAVLWFGGIEINSGNMSQGDIIAYINYLSMILLALVVVSNLVVTFTKAAASAARVNEIFETSPTVSNDSHNTDLQFCLGAPLLSFHHVSFAYPNSAENALQDIDFSINAGQTIGIIGGTGSGKSTLARLIPRLYDVTKGSIAYCGCDIRKIPQQKLRQKISMAFQNASLFSGTIEDNIRFGNSEISYETVVAAAKVAQAEEFILRMPQGYQSHIEQGGKNLSGGQKQRLNVARALAQMPEILILDDTSSALDYATDLKMRTAIREYSRDMAVIIISQRASVLTDANCILVLDDGHIAGIGSHEELLKSCPVYVEICQSQALTEQKGAN